MGQLGSRRPGVLSALRASLAGGALMSRPPIDPLADLRALGLWPRPPYDFPALPIPWTLPVVASPGSASAADVDAVLGALAGITLIWRFTSVHDPHALAGTIRAAAAIPAATALLVVRGGGADLRAFNDRRVLLALAGAPLFTILGVGHAADTVWAGRVVDHEAITPTAAAAFVAAQRRACPLPPPTKGW